MTTIETTLARNTTGLGRVALTLAVTTAAAAILGLSAQVVLPNPIVPGVPITLQVMVVALIALVLGRNLGTAAVAQYVAMGALGVPWFSAGGAGLVRLLGPTGGYLLGFIVMAFVIGAVMEASRNPGRVRAFVASLAGLLVLYAFGATWFGTLLALAASGAVPATFPASTTAWVNPTLTADLGSSFLGALPGAMLKAWTLTVAGFILVDVAKLLVAAGVYQGGRELIGRLGLRPWN